MFIFLCSISEILQNKDADTSNPRGQATVLGRMRRLLSVQEPAELHTRPSLKRHTSDISSFRPFGPVHHFHPREEEKMHTHSKLHSLRGNFYPLSTVNEVTGASASPDSSQHTPSPDKIPSLVISEDVSESVEQESSAQVQEHHGKEVNTAQGVTDTQSRRFRRFSPASKIKRNQWSVQQSRHSSVSSAKSFPSPKDVQRRNQQQETLLQQTSGTADSSSQEKQQRQNQES